MAEAQFGLASLAERSGGVCCLHYSFSTLRVAVVRFAGWTTGT